MWVWMEWNEILRRKGLSDGEKDMDEGLSNLYTMFS